MRRALRLLLLCFGCLCGSGREIAAAAEQSRVSETGGLSKTSSYPAYVEKVVAFERSYYVAGAVSVYSYLDTTSFQKIVDASTEDPELCIQFLSEKKYTEGQRRIAILSMYKLSIDQHVAFVRNLVKLRDRDLISPEELMGSLIPRLSADMIYENYRDKGVQSLLKELEARNDISSSDKNEIRNILSGEALEERRKFDRECCSTVH